MATTGNIGTAPNGQQVTTQAATSTYTGDQLNFIANDEKYNGVSAEQAETDLHNTENQPGGESADQKLQDAEKKWADAFNAMFSNTIQHRAQDTGLNAEAGSSTHTGGSQGA